MKKEYPNSMTNEEYELAKQHYATAYLEGDPNGDCHGHFARLIGTSRNRAKEVCYMFQWRHDCHPFRSLRENHRVIRAFVKRVKQGSTGMTSTYEILAQAEELAEKSRRGKP